MRVQIPSGLLLLYEALLTVYYLGDDKIMKGTVSPELRAVLNDPELRDRFLNDYYEHGFINYEILQSVKPKPKKKRNLLDILLGK